MMGTATSFIRNRSHSRIFPSPKSSSISRITSFFCRASTDCAASETTTPQRAQAIAPSAKFQEKAMSQKIRITTRADHFERRKQEHLQPGYLIEDEQPFPMNGF